MFSTSLHYKEIKSHPVKSSAKYMVESTTRYHSDRLTLKLTLWKLQLVPLESLAML